MRPITPLLLAALLAPVPAFAAQYFMYVGAYTQGLSKGIYAWSFDSKDGSLKPLGLVATTPQPAHLWIAPKWQDALHRELGECRRRQRLSH